VPSSEKPNIIRDFSRKRESYFTLNYGTETPGNYLRRLRRRLIVEAVGDVAAAASVLDAGCGPVILYPEIFERCSRYEALDLTPSNLEQVGQTTQSPKLTCVLGDLDLMEWQKAAYDVVICSGAMEYTTNPREVLTRMVASVKSGGLLVCSFPNSWSPYRIWGEYAYTPISQAWHRWRGEPVARYSRKLFSPRDVQAWLADDGRRIEVQYFGYNFFLQPLDRLLAKLDYSLAMHLQTAPPALLRPSSSEFLLIVRC
jgi:2-polyprenyl-3-methyl-5-hydroxy-6-metoxy-1,4-benzoquinol methylase